MSGSAFDRAAEYREQLASGIRLSGEEQQFFVEGRVAELVRRLPSSFVPRRVLDFGCGLGDTSAHLAASGALRAMVAESNRHDHIWFVPDLAALDARLGAAG